MNSVTACGPDDRFLSSARRCGARTPACCLETHLDARRMGAGPPYVDTSVQCRKLFPFLSTCINCGADPLVRSRPPGRLAAGGKHLMLERRAGPGGPAQPRGSAPQLLQHPRFWEKLAALRTSA